MELQKQERKRKRSSGENDSENSDSGNEPVSKRSNKGRETDNNNEPDNETYAKTVGNSADMEVEDQCLSPGCPNAISGGYGGYCRECSIKKEEKLHLEGEKKKEIRKQEQEKQESYSGIFLKGYGNDKDELTLEQLAKDLAAECGIDYESCELKDRVENLKKKFFVKVSQLQGWSDQKFTDNGIPDDGFRDKIKERNKNLDDGQGLTDYGLETKKQQISLAFLAQQFNWQELKQKLPEQQFVDSNNVHFLAKQVPLRAGQPSLLHAQLPCDNPTNKRMKAVKTAIDANRFVLSCAVSGAGKTRLAFDLAKQHKALYFDLNGGLGKEPQRDVSVFRENIDLLIAQIADAHLSDCHKAVLREKGCASLTQALVLSRWISLVLATQSESPQDWLNHQLHEDIFYCSAEIYSSCKEWDQQTRDSVWKELRSMGTTPLLILDEAQYLAKHHKELFKDSQGNANCRPIGACIIRELLNMQLTGFMAGTSMGLGDFEQIISNLGGDTTEGSLMWYSYDFLRDVSDEKIEDSLCIVPISGLFSHFVQTDLLQQTTLECIYRELQGRPRFMASYIQALIKRYGSWIPPDLDVYFLEVLFDHLKRTTFAREGNASLWVAWQKLYDLCDSNPRLWNAALGLLTRGLLHHGEPLLFHEKLEANDLECVSHGISMLAKAIDTQAHQFLAEPMVINAGLDFALTKGIDLAKEYLLEVLHSEPTRAGKALEFLVAIRIFQNKGKELGEMWPHLAEHESKEVKNLAKLKIPEFKGILVGASLLDKRLNMSNREQAEYIVLPHNHAGPDVVAWLLWVSCKFSHAVQISAKERKKSARTSNPNAAYRNKNGVPRDGKWREHHDAFACIVESWKQPCLRMRLELATGQEPEKVADNQQLAEPAKEDLRRSPRTKAKDNVYSTEPADDNERLGSSMVPSEIEVISSYQFLCPNQERSHDIQFYIDSATVEKYFRLN